MVRPIEIIFRGVRHARFLADVCRVGTGRGRRAACGVHALDVSHPAEFAAALVRHRLEQEPWDRTGVGRGAALQHRADHFAAVFVFPSGPGVVQSHGFILVVLLKQHRLRRLEYPTVQGRVRRVLRDDVNLHADGEGV